MRRKDREMNADFAWEVFDKAPFATLSMVDEDQKPYCIPISPAKIGEKVYFHCAKAGKKIDCLKNNPAVTLVCVSKSVPTDYKFTLEYESAVMDGLAVIVEDDTEKIDALRAICERYTPKNMPAFDAAVAKSLSITNVIRVDVSSVYGKRKAYDHAGEEMKWGRME